MKKGFVFACGLVVAVVGCDSEENAEVGAFSSSLSAEEASVQDLTFTQKDTLCEEFAGYGDAKFQSLEDTYGCFGAVADATAGMDVEVTDPCAEEDKYLNCSATVAELEACGEEYATFSYLSAAAFFSGAAEVAEEQGAAPESEEEGGTEEGLEGLGAALGEAFGVGSCEAPAPTPFSEECLVVATACPELFPDVGIPTNELPGGDMSEMEGGEEAAAEEGGEEAAAEEGGEEAAAEEGGEEAAAEEGGEA